MKKSLRFADGPVEEYQARMQRARALMERYQLDALLLTDRENLRYFAGWFDGAWAVNNFCWLFLLPRAAELEPTFLAMLGDEMYEPALWVEDIRYWSFGAEGWTSASPAGGWIGVLLGALREKGLSQATIGMPLSSDFRVNLGQAQLDALRQQLAGAHLVDASDLLWELRGVKSPAEVARLREACRISCLGVRAGFEALREGLSERDIANKMYATMFELGASEIQFYCLYAGPRQMWWDSQPRRDYHLQRGDLIQFDGGCLYEGYHCDFKRMAALGRPTAEQARYYDLTRWQIEAAIAVMRPGIPLKEVYLAQEKVLVDAGHGAFARWCREAGWSAIGHSIGLNIHEQPGITAGSETLMQAGMVFSVEPFISHGAVTPMWKASGKYGLEDVVLITPQGHEVLTKEEYLGGELWVA